MGRRPTGKSYSSRTSYAVNESLRVADGVDKEMRKKSIRQRIANGDMDFGWKMETVFFSCVETQGVRWSLTVWYVLRLVVGVGGLG